MLSIPTLLLSSLSMPLLWGVGPLVPEHMPCRRDGAVQLRPGRLQEHPMTLLEGLINSNGASGGCLILS